MWCRESGGSACHSGQQSSSCSPCHARGHARKVWRLGKSWCRERGMVVYWRRDREDSITAHLSLHAQHHPLGPVSGKCGWLCVHAAVAQWLHVSSGLPDTQQRILKLSMQVLPEHMRLCGTSMRLRLPSQPQPACSCPRTRRRACHAAACINSPRRCTAEALLTMNSFL